MDAEQKVKKQIRDNQLLEKMRFLLCPPLKLSPKKTAIWISWIFLQSVIDIILLPSMGMIIGFWPETSLECATINYHPGCVATGVVFLCMAVLVVFIRLSQLTYHLYRYRHGKYFTTISEHHQQILELMSLLFWLCVSLTAVSLLSELSQINFEHLGYTNSSITNDSIVKYHWPWENEYLLPLLGFMTVLGCFGSFFVDVTYIIIVAVKIVCLLRDKMDCWKTVIISVILGCFLFLLFLSFVLLPSSHLGLPRKERLHWTVYLTSPSLVALLLVVYIEIFLISELLKMGMKTKKVIGFVILVFFITLVFPTISFFAQLFVFEHNYLFFFVLVCPFGIVLTAFITIAFSVVYCHCSSKKVKDSLLLVDF